MQAAREVVKEPGFSEDKVYEHQLSISILIELLHCTIIS